MSLRAFQNHTNMIDSSDRSINKYRVREFNLILIVILFFSFVSVGNASETVIARYLQIELPGDNRDLALAEVQVFSGLKIVSQQGKAKQVSTFSKADASKAIDGKINGSYFSKSVAVTNKGSFVWWLLDLGGNQVVSSIKIFNRTDCCRNRIVPARVLLFSDEKKIVWENKIISVQSEYKFVVATSTNKLLKNASNLLRNSTFRKQTNVSIPDYWDLHHAAALKFKNLHMQYGIDSSIKSPIDTAQVLKIQNSENNFSFTILMPRKLYIKLPEGYYTFSVYAKSKSNNSLLRIKQRWGRGKQDTKKISTDWKRYSTTFYVAGLDTEALQPILYFPTNTTYFISAPQLEKGKVPSKFQISYSDLDTKYSFSSHKKSPIQFRDFQKIPVEQDGRGKIIEVRLEYDYYTDDQTARLSIISDSQAELTAHIKCASLSDTSLITYNDLINILPFKTLVIEIPLQKMPVGNYNCNISAYEGRKLRASNDIKLKKLLPNLIETRFNNGRNYLIVNDKPFYIIGIIVGEGAFVPNWYLQEIRQNGINTLFYNVKYSSGEFDMSNVKSLLYSAKKYNLKVIVGLPIARTKPPNWMKRIQKFSKLINNLKNYKSIIGWYVVDEPDANVWSDEDLLDIFNMIKNIDPYRLIFVNWAYDGIPKEIGVQPRGTLKATDIYSIDYYPFAGEGRTMRGYTDTTVRALETAKMNNKASHSWLQLFGGMNAWREPTGAELNYMAYLNFMYGSMISYFDTKSNSKITWKKLAQINRQGKILAELLFQNDDAQEIIAPTVAKNYLYSAWKNGERIYLIVIHAAEESEDFNYDVSKLVSIESIVSTKLLFEKGDIKLKLNKISDRFRPYDSRVYVLTTE